MDNNALNPHENLQLVPEVPFSFQGYQVVRGEFFSHLYEPSISFSKGKFYVNSACLKKLPDVDYVHILVSSEEKRLVLRPCNEDDKDAILWRTKANKPKQIIGPTFFPKIMKLMDWNPDYRYKVLGKLISTGNEFLLVFDLASREAYPKKTLENGIVISGRKPSYPEGWENQFGLPVDEHQKQLEVNIIHGYVVFSLKDKASNVPKEVADNAQD